MRSIRNYLLTRLLGGATLVIAVAGVMVYLVVAGSLEAQFDRNLTDRAQGFLSLINQTPNHIDFAFSGELMPEYDREEQPDYFELWFEDGTLFERSEGLERLDQDLVIAGTPSESPLHWSAPLPDGRSGRYIAQIMQVHHVFPELGPDRPQAAKVLVTLARGRESLLAAERMVLLQCVSACLALIGLIAWITWRSVHRGLEPANRLARRLASIRADHLPQSLNIGELPAELLPVAETTDALIRRVDDALQRERRTSADIAHQLRTPVSELLTVSEVALRNGMDVDDSREVLGTVRTVADRMGRSISTLLKLARLEMGHERFAREPVDLGAIVAECLRSHMPLGKERALRVANEVSLGETVQGDPEVLRIVVSNLISNALYYSPMHGLVEARVERNASGWTLRVENDAGDLKQDDLAALSEPFWRKDRSRTDGNRSGLGLSLSCALGVRSGLSVEFRIVNQRFQALISGTPAQTPASPPPPNGAHHRKGL